jgi:pyrroloquinoline quinone (PQQ) biosynthesis protein C
MSEELTLEEARQFWTERWNAVLILNQHILPNLVRRCPDFDARVAIWPGIAVEYGNGDLSCSHPVLYQRFLLALGVPIEHCPMRLSLEDAAEQVRRIEQQSWHQLLGRFLGRETVGPKVFPNIEAALVRAFALSSHDLAWFSRHGAHGVHDADVVFALCRRYGQGAAQQEKILAGLHGWFDESPYCYRFGAIALSYAAWTRSYAEKLSS